LGVLDPVGYPSFERVRDGVPNMWKWTERKTKKKGGKKMNVTICRLNRVQFTLEQDTKAQMGVEV